MRVFAVVLDGVFGFVGVCDIVCIPYILPWHYFGTQSSTLYRDLIHHSSRLLATLPMNTRFLLDNTLELCRHDSVVDHGEAVVLASM